MYIVKHMYIYIGLWHVQPLPLSKEAANGRNFIKIYQEEIGSQT